MESAENFLRVSTKDVNNHFSSNLQRYRSDDFYLEKMKEILAVKPNTRPPSEPVEVAENVFMGSQKHANDYELLQRYGITHVVNCAAAGIECDDGGIYNGTSLYPDEVGIVECILIGAVDHEEYDISTYFDSVINFLVKVEHSGGRVLVHCNLGVNRSGAVVAAYLMVRNNSTLLSVVDYLKQKRSVILSNRGFRKQLVSFARKNGFLDTFNDSDSSELTCSNQNSKSSFLKAGSDRKLVVRFQQESKNLCKNETVSNVPTKSNSGFSFFKSKLQSVIKPQTGELSGRFWSLPRSWTKHVKTKCKSSDITSTNVPEVLEKIERPSDQTIRRLEPVYEHSETKFFAESIGSYHFDVNKTGRKNYPSDLNLSRARSDSTGSRSFMSFFRNRKSTSCSDVRALNHSPSTASMLEGLSSPTFSSSTRPLKISASIGSTIHISSYGDSRLRNING